MDLMAKRDLIPQRIPLRSRIMRRCPCSALLVKPDNKVGTKFIIEQFGRKYLPQFKIIHRVEVDSSSGRQSVICHPLGSSAIIKVMNPLEQSVNMKLTRLVSHSSQTLVINTLLAAYDEETREESPLVLDILRGKSIKLNSSSEEVVIDRKGPCCYLLIPGVEDQTWSVHVENAEINVDYEIKISHEL